MSALIVNCILVLTGAAAFELSFIKFLFFLKMLESSGRASMDLRVTNDPPSLSCFLSLSISLSLSLSLSLYLSLSLSHKHTHTHRCTTHFISISTGVSLVTPMSSISSLLSLDLAFSDVSIASGSLVDHNSTQHHVCMKHITSFYMSDNTTYHFFAASKISAGGLNPSS